ncbi:hypothetical protein W97_07847 [Coniosporium apollinis CBS 100218]|uniref:Uncharacterized protein n=1 Tax=Coniosporium apollinis (strain CBS 100218) TaxID=1168221 RepID=R7Z3L1_CONA1|nr:uncharacterized protein W97_07847 [Coniosporium apollinis CBS 100218]EON68589.1 hypothetical protein W97_07847 [Coniosporium apollinis CBS 100218]
MPFLRLPRAFSPRVLRITPSFRPTPAFSTSARLRLKEDKERSPEEVEAAKQKQLKKQEEGKGEWHEELASSSESGIAADRQEVQDHDEHMEDLQKETAKKGEKGDL